MERNMEERVKQIMADIFDINPRKINKYTSMDNVASWDSLKHINLILELEQEFRISLDTKEIEAMLSFDNILKTLKMKL
jgi:acyl carrier protein